MADVYKEIWTGEVEKKFRAMANFLNVIPNKDEYVGNSVIHLTDLGADPEVLIDNTVYPIATAASADDDVTITLRKLETTNTKVTDDELYAISYDKIKEKTDQHTATLLEKAGALAAHSLSPQSHTANTPVLETSGAVVDGRNLLTPGDVAKLKKAFDDQKIPQQDRHLVLCPQHVLDLLLTSQTFEKHYSDIRSGKVLPLWGFTIHEYVDTVYYDGTTGAKLSFGAAPDVGDVQSSFAFYAPKMVKAMGENAGQPVLKMYWRAAETDPENRESVVGFRTRFVCLPKVNRYYGAIAG